MQVLLCCCWNDWTYLFGRDW